MMNKTRVLFLGLENSARSQMAEAFLRYYAGDKYEVYSAGVDSSAIHPLTLQVMAEIGIDISSQHSKSLKDYMGVIHFGYVITVCSQADDRCPITFPGMGQRLRWDFENPSNTTGSDEIKLNKFREIRDMLKQKVMNWVQKQNQDKRSLLL
jgi:arsenate reductase (thioredoxin)